MNNGIVNQYSFGLNLNFQSNASSYVTFGRADPSLYHGNLNMVKIVGQLSYNIRLDAIQMGNNGPNMAIYTAILDSGNTCITMPSRF